MEAGPLQLTFVTFWVRNTVLLAWVPSELLIPLKQRGQREVSEIFVNQYSSERLLRMEFSPPHHKPEGYLVLDAILVTSVIKTQLPDFYKVSLSKKSLGY